MSLPATGLSTDVGMIISAAFPGGKPEMAANDFKKAYDITRASLDGKPRPARTSLDYPTWAHCLMVEWKLVCEKMKKAGKPEPNYLTCPECGVAMLLDHSQSNVLTCPGGCNRAITVQAFTALFRNVKPPPRASSIPRSSAAQIQQAQQHRSQQATSVLQAMASAGPISAASITGHIPVGTDPVAAGIVEKMPKSRKPLESWRCWKIMDDGLAPRLRSISYDEYWDPMTPITAKCTGKSRDEIDHDCPSWHHRCGVYSVKNLADVSKWSNYAMQKTNQVGAIGKIEMWGRVLEYKDGYRSEHAYPLSLWLPEKWEGNFTYTWANPAELAERLWEQYLVEVNLSDEVFYELILRG